MSRLSFRPRPLDIHKKLPILKSFKDFEDEDNPSSITRNSQLLRISAVEVVDNEVQPPVPSKKLVSEIPTPQYLVVDTYERDYSRTFNQPASYLRARGARAELGEFVEYDLDNDDDDWLYELEIIIFKLEVLDHKARERAGVITPTLGLPVPVLLQLDAASEALALQSLPIKYGVFQAIYSYWKNKRERWQKPILRRLQPPPPVNDTNPYNVFRPREKAHRLHTRRMQRRENNAQSFEKLRQVRRNLDQAKTILEALIKREEKKRDFMASEVSLQRIQLKYKNETELLEDSLALAGFPLSTSYRFGSSEDEFMDSDDPTTTQTCTRPSFTPHPRFTDSTLARAQAGSIKQEARRLGWLHKLNHNEPVMLFTKPLVPDKMAAAGIIPPSDARSGRAQLQGRIGRGGRIVFDRWNPLNQAHINCGNTFYIAP